jgi:hypothetical protein
MRRQDVRNYALPGSFPVVMALVGLAAYGTVSGALPYVWVLVALGALGACGLAVTGAALCVGALESLGALNES